MILSATLADAAGTDITLHAATGKRKIRSATGLLGGGVAPPRALRRVRPQAHGGIDDTAYTDGRIITLECEASSQVSLEDAYTEYRAMVAPMQDTLDHGKGLLKWTEGAAGLQLQRYVKAMSEVDAPLEEAAAMLVFPAQFFSEDPRSYSQTLNTVVGASLSTLGGGKVFPFTYPRTYASSGGGTLSLTTLGKKSSPPVLRIYGYCQNPQVVLTNTGERLVFGGSVAVPTASVSNGNYLEIDVAARTVRLNGATDSGSNLRNLLNSPASSWFELPAATVCNLQLVASDFDATARVDVVYRDAY